MNDLRERFDRDLAGLLPPRDLETVVVARGRRLRARRRAGQAAGGLVTTAAGTALVISLMGGSGGTAAEPGIATDPPPQPSPVAEVRPTGWWDMPARRMLTTLTDVLPEGVTVSEVDAHAEGEDGPVKAFGSLHGVLASDAGPGAFQVLLYAPDPTEPLPGPVTTTDADGTTETGVEVAGPSLAQRIRCRTYMTTCEPLLDAAGTVIGRVDTDTDQGTTYYEVVLAAPDGGALYMYVADSSGEKPGYEQPSASEPPLTTDELVALAQDPAWASYEPAR